MGGLRNGSGRSKSGYYKGIYCGSTYELCWVIYNLDHNISFSRFSGYLTDGKIKYYPDFILSDTNEIIEIKGFLTESVKIKTQLAIDKGFKIKVLYKEDLKNIFSYVEQKYFTKNFYTLYDDFKPKLNETQIQQILNDLDSYANIAKKFKIHKSMVGFIKNKLKAG